MRQKKPFYWTARKAWYLELNGKQVKLGAAESKTRTPPQDVMLEYHRIMAGEGMLTRKEKRTVTVATAVEAFIETKTGLRAASVKACTHHLEAFAVRYSTKRVEDVTEQDVLKFLKGRASWGPTTRHNSLVTLKGLFKWAKKVGYVAESPLDGAGNPFRAGHRDRGISLGEFEAMFAATRDDAFRLMLRCLRDTGARPGELCVLAARHLHPGQPVATLKPHEHKTGDRTGKTKTIILPGGLADELRGLAERYPSGPLLRNTKGDPWKVGTIGYRVRRMREKLGLPGHVVPYAARHAFLTRLVETGVPLAIAAKIAGHESTSTIMDVYLHPEMASMQQAVSLAAGETTRETPAQTIARLTAEIEALKNGSRPSGA